MIKFVNMIFDHDMMDMFSLVNFSESSIVPNGLPFYVHMLALGSFVPRFIGINRLTEWFAYSPVHDKDAAQYQRVFFMLA